MKKWYDIKSQADSAEISIFDEIGAWGVTAKDFIADLKQQAGKQITVTINSPGGSVFDALAMYNALRGHGSPISTKVMGVAASAASLIFMSGDKRIIPENCFLMVHNPLTFAYGNAGELRDTADVLDKIAASLVSTYVSRSGLGEEEVKALLDEETWLNAADALEKGFATETVAEMKIAAAFDMDRLPENIKSIFASEQIAPEPEPEQDAVADQVAALASSAGLTAYAPIFALKCANVEVATVAIAKAKEIIALCAVAGKPDVAEPMIRADKTVEDVRAELLDALATDDEGNQTDGQQPSETQPANTAQKVKLKTADVWAARRTN